MQYPFFSDLRGVKNRQEKQFRALKVWSHIHTVKTLTLVRSSVAVNFGLGQVKFDLTYPGGQVEISKQKIFLSPNFLFCNFERIWMS